MTARVWSAQKSIHLKFEISGIESTTDGTIYIDGVDKDGALFTIKVEGTDLDNKNIVELFEGITTGNFQSDNGV